MRSVRLQLEELQPVFTRVHEARLAASAEQLRDLHWEEWFKSTGTLDSDSALGDRLPSGSTEDEMRPVAQRDLALIREACEAYARHFAGKWVPTELDEIEAKVGPLTGSRRDIYLRVAKSIDREATTGTLAYALPDVPLSPLPHQRQDERIRREGELALQIRILQGELSAIEDERRALSQSNGISGGLGALTFFALLGIAYPMALMSRRPVPDSPAARWSMVGAFVFGFAVFIGYLWRRVKTLAVRDG